jgi:hypothetical protein
MDEIVALKKQRQITGLGQGIGEAIAHVEPRLMSGASAETGIGGLGHIKLNGVEGDDLGANQFHDLFQPRRSVSYDGATRHAETFMQRRGAHPARGIPIKEYLKSSTPSSAFKMAM